MADDTIGRTPEWRETAFAGQPQDDDSCAHCDTKQRLIDLTTTPDWDVWLTALDAHIAAVRAEQKPEIVKAVEAERAELFCPVHRDWNDSPDWCPLCEYDAQRKEITELSHALMLAREREKTLRTS